MIATALFGNMLKFEMEKKEMYIHLEETLRVYKL